MADKKTTKAKTMATKEANVVKTIEQLRDELATKITDQLEAKRGHHQGELTNPHILTGLRKEIARLHTAIRAAEIAVTKEIK